MLIKYPELSYHLKKNIHPLYFLTGTDTYLLEDAITQIKSAWLQKGPYDEKRCQIQAAADWSDSLQEANHYSLFATQTFINIRYDKKTIDGASQSSIKQYLENPNQHSLVLIEAPHLPTKQLQFIAKHTTGVLIPITSLSQSAFELWIKRTLEQKGLRFESNVPPLIHQYNQHNMLAAKQLMDKLGLLETSFITKEMLLPHLTDQCEYALFELTEAFLSADANQSIHLLRRLQQNRAEPTLILWLISQEIRLLIQWHQLMQQSISTDAACKKLNTWPQRTKYYNSTIKRLGLLEISRLLTECHLIDKQIKSMQSYLVWNSLENLLIRLTEKK